MPARIRAAATRSIPHAHTRLPPLTCLPNSPRLGFSLCSCRAITGQRFWPQFQAALPSGHPWGQAGVSPRNPSPQAPRRCSHLPQALKASQQSGGCHLGGLSCTGGLSTQLSTPCCVHQGSVKEKPSVSRRRWGQRSGRSPASPPSPGLPHPLPSPGSS